MTLSDSNDEIKRTNAMADYDIDEDGLIATE